MANAPHTRLNVRTPESVAASDAFLDRERSVITQIEDVAAPLRQRIRLLEVELVDTRRELSEAVLSRDVLGEKLDDAHKELANARMSLTPAELRNLPPNCDSVDPHGGKVCQLTEDHGGSCFARYDDKSHNWGDKDRHVRRALRQANAAAGKPAHIGATRSGFEWPELWLKRLTLGATVVWHKGAQRVGVRVVGIIGRRVGFGAAASNITVDVKDGRGRITRDVPLTSCNPETLSPACLQGAVTKSTTTKPKPARQARRSRGRKS